jgi:hypothetical protein
MGTQWMRRGVEWRTITRILYEEIGKMNTHERRGRACYTINSSKKRQHLEWGEMLEELVGRRWEKKDSALGYMGYAVYTFGPTNHKPPTLVFRVEAQKTLGHMGHTNVG